MRNRFSLLLVIFLVQLNIIFAQDCSCPEYDVLRNKYTRSGSGARTFSDQLVASGKIICKAKGNEWIANEYLEESNFDTAEIYFRKAEKLYKESGCSDSVFVSIYKNWAQLHYTKGDFGKAQEFSFKLLKAAEAYGNPHEIGVCNTMIAQLFNQTGQAEKGIVYSRKAVLLLDKIKDTIKKSDLLAKLTKRYLWHYQDTKTSSSLDSSELLSYQLLHLARLTDRKNSIAFAFSNLEGIAWERGDLKKALILLDSSFLYTGSQNYDMLGTNYFDKADIYIELGDYTNAAKMADSSLHYRKLIDNKIYIAEGYELIARIGKESGDYKKAYEYKEMARVIIDSVRNVEKTKEVSELERKYTQEKNEQKIKSLVQQKRIYVLLATAGLFALLGLVFFIRQQAMKNKQRILETEQRLNRARMNPHFFFNALSSLQSFALEGHDGKSIASNLSKFSHIMRETLESTYKEYVTVTQEKEFLEEYMELQAIRNPGRFANSIVIDEEVDADETIMPSMILQPFVENSIEHGFAGINYAGLIQIRFDKRDRELEVSIIDNGKGLISGPRDNNEHISRASQIIKDRIYLLNIKLKTKASFSIDSNINGKGVTVLIRLPLLYKPTPASG